MSISGPISGAGEQQPMSEINVTPLVDVMLVLLVIFIVTAPLLMQAVKVDLPRTAAVAPVKEARTLQLTIGADGALHLDRRALALADLETELKAQTAGRGELAVHLHADTQVPYGRVAEVMAAASRAGVGKLAFVTGRR